METGKYFGAEQRVFVNFLTSFHLLEYIYKITFISLQLVMPVQIKVKFLSCNYVLDIVTSKKIYQTNKFLSKNLNDKNLYE